MCAHTETPSRLKDLFDVWYLITKNTFKEAVVAKSILIVFENRNNTPLPSNTPTILTETFASSENGQKLWLNFKKRIRGNIPEFAVIRKDLREYLMRHAELARKLDD